MKKERTVTELMWNDSPEHDPHFYEPVEITTTIYVRNKERYARTLFGYVHTTRYDLTIKLRKLAHKFHILADDYKVLEYKKEKLEKKVTLLEKENLRLQNELCSQQSKQIAPEMPRATAQETSKVADELKKTQRLLRLSQQNCAALEMKSVSIQNAQGDISRKRCVEVIKILDSENDPKHIIAQVKRYLLHKEDCGGKKKKSRRRNKNF
ncbi:MAG: hypothetical protein NTX91_02760 [candidate division SR1 bacterium]|nr:hypothetical protein [candidate division SR1 bacterium]